MAKGYSQEQLWKLYKGLPQELKEAIFSEETANNIYDICIRNGVKDGRISEIARYAGRVLLGVLPPEDFQKTLEKELDLEKETAKKITHEANRFIFFPVKESLAELYGEKEERLIKTRSKVEIPSLEEIAPSEGQVEEEPKKTDIYREAIE